MRALVVMALIGCGSREEAVPAKPSPVQAPSDAAEPDGITYHSPPQPDGGPPPRKVSDAPATHELVATRGESPTPLPPGERMGLVEISTSGGRYATFERQGNKSCKVRVHELADRRQLYAGDHGCDVNVLALSPDATQLAIALPDKIEVVDVNTAKLVKELPIAKANDIVWITAGLIVKRARELALVDPATGTSKPAGQSVSVIAANGNWLVGETVLVENAVPPCPPADCFPAPRLGYDLVDLATGSKKRLEFPELSGTVAVSAGGAVAIKTLYVLYPYTSTGEAIPPLGIGFIGDGDPAALSDDGRWYALVDGDYHLRIFDVVAGTLVAEEWLRDRVGILKFDREGRLHGYRHNLMTWTLVKKK